MATKRGWLSIPLFLITILCWSLVRKLDVVYLHEAKDIAGPLYFYLVKKKGQASLLQNLVTSTICCNRSAVNVSVAHLVWLPDLGFVMATTSAQRLLLLFH